MPSSNSPIQTHILVFVRKAEMPEKRKKILVFAFVAMKNLGHVTLLQEGITSPLGAVRIA